MQTILVAGAGKSSIYLIQYLLENASKNKWRVVVADGDANAINSKIKKHSRAEAAVIDITKQSEREPLVQEADIVLSLMPPHLHVLLAKDCLKHKKHLITSSYMSDEVKAMDQEVKDAGLMFMCEMGLDPGIDHMTACKMIHGIRKVTGRITGFRSFCGGLIAPESDRNPWHYKISWNPRNIVLAGTGGAKYLLNGKEMNVPYEKMFEQTRKLKIPGLNALAYYANRDSLKYRQLYDVQDIRTLLRATLRYPSFCKGWDAIVKLGLTSTTDNIDTSDITYADWIRLKTGLEPGSDLKRGIARLLLINVEDAEISLLNWLGLFGDEKIGQMGEVASSEILLALLQEKWKMEPGDKDMVVMHHEMEYEHKGRFITLKSSMVLKGEGGEYTAMAKTVGMPMAILATLVLGGKLQPPTGVLLPVMQSVYRPVLRELEQHGIIFHEEVS